MIDNKYLEKHFIFTISENAEAGERMKRDIATRKEEDERKAERLKTQARISNSENVENKRALQVIVDSIIMNLCLSIQMFAQTLFCTIMCNKFYDLQTTLECIVN